MGTAEIGGAVSVNGGGGIAAVSTATLKLDAGLTFDADNNAASPTATFTLTGAATGNPIINVLTTNGLVANSGGKTKIVIAPSSTPSSAGTYHLFQYVGTDPYANFNTTVANAAGYAYTLVDNAASHEIDLTATVAGTAPQITSANHTTFTAGTGGTFSVTASGVPTDTLTETATLPSGVTFADNGNNTGSLAVSTSAAAGVYNLTFTATNGTLPNATQSFTLTVARPADHARGERDVHGGHGRHVQRDRQRCPDRHPGGDGDAARRCDLYRQRQQHRLAGGEPSAAAGVYDLTFTAANGIGSTPRRASPSPSAGTPQITARRARDVHGGHGRHVQRDRQRRPDRHPGGDGTRPAA